MPLNSPDGWVTESTEPRGAADGPAAHPERARPVRSIGLVLASLCLVSATVTTAQVTHQPDVRPVRLENAGALFHFHDALRSLRQGRTQRVRVLHWGDSNVAADLWTAVARDTLQQRFGDGGSGYLLPRGHGSWHRGPVSLHTQGRWVSRRRGFAGDFGPNDGLWGIAGVGLEPVAPRSVIRADVPAANDERVFELHLLGRPRPMGHVEVRVDDGEWERVGGNQHQPGLVLRRWPLDRSPHAVRVRHAGGRPRILGMVVERAHGVVYDVLGINGHRASAILSWRSELLAQQLASRQPDLVVLSYGGNEALDPNLPLRTYERQTREAVDRIRTLAPSASCLLVGPLATYPRYAARMGAVTQVQRHLAAELGCAFWDSSLTSGGPGTLRRWARFPGMVGRDHLHLGRHGYEEVGRVFADALLRDL